MLGYYANSADPVQMLSNVASHRGLHCLLTQISMENAVNMKIQQKPLETRNGRVQIIRMDKSIGLKGLNLK